MLNFSIGTEIPRRWNMYKTLPINFWMIRSFSAKWRVVKLQKCEENKPFPLTSKSAKDMKQLET